MTTIRSCASPISCGRSQKVAFMSPRAMDFSFLRRRLWKGSRRLHRSNYSGPGNAVSIGQSERFTLFESAGGLRFFEAAHRRGSTWNKHLKDKYRAESI